MELSIGLATCFVTQDFAWGDAHHLLGQDEVPSGLLMNFMIELTASRCVVLMVRYQVCGDESSSHILKPRREARLRVVQNFTATFSGTHNPLTIVWR